MLHFTLFPTSIHAFNYFCLQNLSQSLHQAEFIFQSPNHIVYPMTMVDDICFVPSEGTSEWGVLPSGMWGLESGGEITPPTG